MEATSGKMNAEEAVALLVDGVRSGRWGVAAVAVVDDEIAYAIDEGGDPITTDSLFQIGSISKTMTGVLFADAVRRGEVTPETTLADVFGITGEARAITLGELATHQSGLPRLPANLEQQDPKDPYAGYSLRDLLAALDSVAPGDKNHLYSNFGFMTLGASLAEVTRKPVPELWEERLFEPLHMTRTGCPGPSDHRLPGYAGDEETPWWTTSTPGAGGVGASLRDIGAYLRAHVSPPESAVGAAIELATTIHAEGPPTMGYGWHFMGGGWWHNGATYGFQSFIAFHRPTRTGVAAMTNTGTGANLDGVGLDTLTALVRERAQR